MRVETIRIPDSVEKIETHAFYYQYGLKAVTIGRGMKEIGNGAFFYCRDLKAVHSLIQEPFATDKSVFTGINAEATLYVPIGTQINYMSTEGWDGFAKIVETTDDALIEGETFTDTTEEGLELTYRVSSLTDKTCELIAAPDAIEGTVTIPAQPSGYTLTSIGSNVFISNSSSYPKRHISKVVVPDNVVSIGRSAFLNCDDLTEIVFPDKLEIIGDWAFYSCEKIVEASLPPTLKQIGSYAFSYNSALEKILIPATVGIIGENSFRGCTHLEKVITKIEKPFAINENVFATKWNNEKSDYEFTDATLFVPVGSKTAYQQVDAWKKFNNIVEGEPGEEPDVIPGDVNMDNAVNGTDLVALSNIVLGRKEKTESADVNGDGSVNGTDIVALSNIILGRSSSAPRRAGEARTGLSIEPFNIKASEEKEMLIDLSNPNDEVTLVQFDLHLPEGLSIKKNGTDLDIDMGDRTSWRKHTLDANETDGGYRFLLYSGSNTVIEGTSGAIIKVKVVADASFKGGKIVIDNTLLVSPDEKETKPEAYEYTFPTADDGSAKLAIEPFDIKAGEEKEMLIDLENPNDEITLVQFDLQLPAGLTVKKSGADLVFDMTDRTSWRKHTLDANETDGGYRFLLYSGSNTVIEGTSGVVIKVTLAAKQDMSGKKIVLDNILLVSPDEKETKPARYEYTIGSETGIRNITMDGQADTPIYNLRGQQLTAPQKGINIIGGKKVVVK